MAALSATRLSAGLRIDWHRDELAANGERPYKIDPLRERRLAPWFRPHRGA